MELRLRNFQFDEVSLHSASVAVVPNHYDPKIPSHCDLSDGFCVEMAVGNRLDTGLAGLAGLAATSELCKRQLKLSTRISTITLEASEALQFECLLKAESVQCEQ